MNTLSVLIPAYNEGCSIRNILTELAKISHESNVLHGLKMELVVINDGSTDNTEDEVKQFIKENPTLDIKYSSQTNSGKGSAVRKAISISSGEIMVIQDADNEYTPSDFAQMLPFILSGEYKVVYGSRFLNHQNKHSYQSFYLGGRLVSFTANFLYGLNLTDEPTCYKMFTREVANSIKLTCKGFEFCPEFTAKVSRKGYKIIEVPIHYNPRSIQEGKKINWKDGVIALWTLVKYRF